MYVCVWQPAEPEDISRWEKLSELFEERSKWMLLARQVRLLLYIHTYIHTYIHCVSSCQGGLLLKELQKHCDVILRHRVKSHVSTIMVEHSEIIRLGEVDSISVRSHIHIHPDLAEIFTHTCMHSQC